MKYPHFKPLPQTPYSSFITVGYSGCLKPASGTWGTLVSMPIAYTLAWLTSPIMLIVFSAILFFIGWWAVAKFEDATGTHDASEIVIDETVGVFITLSIVPLELSYYILGFIAFRIFDIFKPYPIKVIDNLKTPFSVMFDDVIAGIMAGLVMWGILWGI